MNQAALAVTLTVTLEYGAFDLYAGSLLRSRPVLPGHLPGHAN
jgi:hypothetical protein